MRRMTALPLALGAVTAQALGTTVPAAAEPVDAGIFVDPVVNLPTDFINGVDVSSVLSLEESGVEFKDADGNVADLFEVLADHGVTDVRIRVWNDPFDAEGRGYGGGNVGVDRAVEIGERADAAGLDVLVNFHYSDFWADPSKQQAPKAWADMGVTEKADATYAFTRDALQQFEDAGVDVTMVQVGNETNGAVAGVSGFDGMSEIFTAGSRAVREVLPDALVAIHFTDPHRDGHYAQAAAALDERNVDYDVFASSYYPFWHGSLANLTSVLTHVADTYDKQVVVAETSWAWTMDDGDGHTNVIDQASEATAYPVSVQGQATAVRDVIQAVADVGDAALGVYYWEPAWLPVGPPDQWEANSLLWEQYGSGWATSYAGEYDPEDAGQWYGGSAWDNQSLFAWDGTPLESLNVFRYARTGAVAPLEVVSVEDVVLELLPGDPVTLPTSVAVTYNDGSTVDDPVRWKNKDLFRIKGLGTFEVAGRTASGLEVMATVIVDVENHLLNPGFEDEDVSMWESEGPGVTVRSNDTPASGSHSTHFWNDEDYAFSVWQDVTGLAPGSYRAGATVQGGDAGDGSLQLVVSVVDGDASATAALELNGWQSWFTGQTEPIRVEDGQTVRVAVVADLPGGAWGTIDDLRLGVATSESSDGPPAVGRPPVVPPTLNGAGAEPPAHGRPTAPPAGTNN